MAKLPRFLIVQLLKKLLLQPVQLLLQLLQPLGRILRAKRNFLAPMSFQAEQDNETIK